MCQVKTVSSEPNSSPVTLSFTVWCGVTLMPLSTYAIIVLFGLLYEPRMMDDNVCVYVEQSVE
jgi:hypothetical protein